jgi:hypothetical protein
MVLQVGIISAGITTITPLIGAAIQSRRLHQLKSPATAKRLLVTTATMELITAVMGRSR